MYPLGHIGITLLFSKLIFKKLGKNCSTKLIIIGSLLPDLLDKPLGLLGIGPGRYIFHSLVFMFLFSFISNELFLGVLFHLILDRMWNYPNILFFPFFGVEITGKYEFFDIIEFFLKDRYSQVGELCGFLCLLIGKLKKVF